MCWAFIDGSTMNKAALVVVRNPFHPALGREQRDIRVGTRLVDVAPAGNIPFIVMLNGQAVLRKDWQQEVDRDDIVAIIYLPRGGGGGGGGSNPLKIVLMIAVAVIAPQIAFGLLGETLAATTIIGGLTYGTVLSAAIGFIGNALINAAFGSSPSTTSSLKTQDMAAPSPTYNLQAQGNMARLDGAIPVQYGRVCAYPDFAAQPFLEFRDNEQYVFELFCLGAGAYDIEQIRIEDTPITNFAEVTTQVVPPGGFVTLFPTSVDTSVEVAGQEMVDETYIGPFVACDVGKTTGQYSFDFIMPRGLYWANDQGGLDQYGVNWYIEGRRIDDSGTPLESFFNVAVPGHTAATSTPQRITKHVFLTAARWEFRVKRAGSKQTGSRYGNDLLWAGMRAYYPSTTSYGDMTMLAVQMRATNNLSSQSSRKINVIATRKLPAWNGSSFGTAAATSSIAWALADICTNATWAAGLSNARVDLDGLLALNAIWAARGDEFNGRFDSSISFWEALTKIARAGRAMPYMQGGIIRFSRDQAQATPVALYSMRNILRGSFSVQYLTPHEAQADAIDVSYFDADVWAPRRVQAKLADSTAAKPVKVDMFGITGRDQAFREGVYEAACNRYRRKLIKFATEMEGFIPSFGDLIAVAHDMPAWGQTSEATAWNVGSLTLTLSEPLTWGTGTHYVGLRKRNGAIDGPIAVTAGGNTYQVVLASAPSFTPYTGQSEERTHVVFGWGETWRQPARVISVRPRGLEQVEIECVNEDGAVHTAEDGLTPPAVQTSQLQTRWTSPVVSDLRAQGQPNDPSTMLLSWQPAPGAVRYIVEQSGDAGGSWTRIGDSTIASMTAKALFAENTLVRVAGVGVIVQGAWVTLDYGPIYTATLALPPLAATGLTAVIENGAVVLTWNANTETDLAGYWVRYGGAEWALATELATLTATKLTVSADWLGSRTFRLKPYDTTRNAPDADATVSIAITAPAAPSLTATISAENVVLEWTAPAATLPVVHYELRYGASWAAGTSVGTVSATTYRQKSDWIGTRTYWIAAVDSAGNVGTPANVGVTITAPSAPVGLQSEVIDNNVLLRWSAPSAGTLPIVTYALRRGSTWDSATDIGTKSGLFTTVLETMAGTYTYWIAGVDSHGNVGTPASIACAVNQPPDYVLRANYVSTFTGTLSSAVVDGARVILLVNTTDTFAQHFTNNSWTTPQNQIDAGYPLYIQPTVSSAYYEETFDYGSVLAANKINVAVATNVITGSAVVTTDISVSETGSSWTTYTGASQVYGTNFRYVKVRVNATTGTSGLVELTSLTVRLDSKLQTITGMVSCGSGDSGGTTVYLTDDRTSGGDKVFIDVDAITLSVAGTTPLIAIYDFTDSADPLSFKVLLYTTAGARASGTASYTVRGF